MFTRLFKRPTNTRKLFQRIDISKVNSTFFGHAYKINIPFKQGLLSKEEIKKRIKANPQFCGDGLSISIADLASYLNNNTVIYHYKDSKLGGVMVIGPKSKSLYIHGICVPKEFKGVGKKLMSISKQIARDNGYISIRLECYGQVHAFYEKQGYKIIEQKELNSNSNSNNESEKKIKYVMEYTITGTSPRTPRVSTSRSRRSGSKSPRTPRSKIYPVVENINY
jgi:hypothetical protein